MSVRAVLVCSLTLTSTLLLAACGGTDTTTAATSSPTAASADASTTATSSPTATASASASASATESAPVPPPLPIPTPSAAVDDAQAFSNRLPQLFTDASSKLATANADARKAVLQQAAVAAGYPVSVSPLVNVNTAVKRLHWVDTGQNALFLNEPNPDGICIARMPIDVPSIDFSTVVVRCFTTAQLELIRQQQQQQQ